MRLSTAQTRRSSLCQCTCHRVGNGLDRGGRWLQGCGRLNVSRWASDAEGRCSLRRRSIKLSARLLPAYSAPLLLSVASLLSRPSPYRRHVYGENFPLDRGGNLIKKGGGEGGGLNEWIWMEKRTDEGIGSAGDTKVEDEYADEGENVELYDRASQGWKRTGSAWFRGWPYFALHAGEPLVAPQPLVRRRGRARAVRVDGTDAYVYDAPDLAVVGDSPIPSVGRRSPGRGPSLGGPCSTRRRGRACLQTRGSRPW